MAGNDGEDPMSAFSRGETHGSFRVSELAQFLGYPAESVKAALAHVVRSDPALSAITRARAGRGTANAKGYGTA